MSAIADLSAWVKDSFSKPKCPLYMSISPKHLAAFIDHASLSILMGVLVSGPTPNKALDVYVRSWLHPPGDFSLIVPVCTLVI